MLNMLFYQISTQTLIFPLAAQAENIALTIYSCWSFCDFLNKNLQKEESDKDSFCPLIEIHDNQNINSKKEVFTC